MNITNPILDESAIKTLNEIKEEIQKVCKKYEFRPNIDDGILEDYKNFLLSHLKHKYPDLKTTKEINKTEWPDEAIVSFIRKEGYDINSIEDFSEVTQEWKYDIKIGKIYISTQFTYRQPLSFRPILHMIITDKLMVPLNKLREDNE